ncbi:hypothetical protein DFP72DRAFT_525086 [Ephemerocybe angulata]|uniref:Uncharacterized protein n=1 Tax=Ephemerocybe angulata TaxID=980116 RepID=A0A8H6ICP4_9AGAR|nr:hypothetical protein DFP72DRAFT_525086 [Tulosesus angulatus]
MMAPQCVGNEIWLTLSYLFGQCEERNTRFEQVSEEKGSCSTQGCAAFPFLSCDLSIFAEGISEGTNCLRFGSREVWNQRVKARRCEDCVRNRDRLWIQWWPCRIRPGSWEVSSTKSAPVNVRHHSSVLSMTRSLSQFHSTDEISNIEPGRATPAGQRYLPVVHSTRKVRSVDPVASEPQGLAAAEKGRRERKRPLAPFFLLDQLVNRFRMVCSFMLMRFHDLAWLFVGLPDWGPRLDRS